MRLSIITPAFNEAMNLDGLYQRLVPAMQEAGVDWEWLIVDDHSGDATFDVIERLALRDARGLGACGCRATRDRTRRSPAHCTRLCGDAAVMMAADLQDPPRQLRRCSNAGAAARRWYGPFAASSPASRDTPGLRSSTTGSCQRCRHERDAGEGNRLLPDRSRRDRRLSRSSARQRERARAHPVARVPAGFLRVRQAKRPCGTSGWTLAKNMKLVTDSVTRSSVSRYGGSLVRRRVDRGRRGDRDRRHDVAPGAGRRPPPGLAVMSGLTGVQLLALASWASTCGDSG